MENEASEKPPVGISTKSAARLAQLIPGGDFLAMNETAQFAFVESTRSKRIKPVRAVKLKVPKEPKVKIAGEKMRKPRVKKIKLETLQGEISI